MFKQIIKTIGLTLSLFFAVFNVSAAEQGYTEGKHYKIISDEPVQEREVREFFSFWCGHCFSLQKPYEYVAKHLPENTKFIASPVSILGGPMGVKSVYGHALARLNGIEHEYIAALFDEMHVKGNIPRSDEYFKDLFAKLGLPNNKYEREINSFAVMAIVSKTDKLVAQYKLDAVPEIIVNGKYLVLQESVESAYELSALVNYLVTLDDVKSGS